ncbi:MAG: CRISPR system precrRNA processing endoribonuclease RAMP protein Cas6 [Planctomycetota bacterium]
MLKYTDLNFRVRFEEEGRLPAYRGTTLRGAFGYALKRTVCVVKHRQCEVCLLRSHCAFPQLFEGVPPPLRDFMRKYPYVPQPMVLRVKTKDAISVTPGARYSFGIRLLGPAVSFYPYAVFAVMEMGRRGLGSNRVPFVVEGVDDNQNSIYANPHGESLQEPECREITLGHDIRSHGLLKLTFLTPLRLRTNGMLNCNPDLSAILRGAIRRLRILTNFYGDPTQLPADIGPVIAVAEKATRVDQHVELYSISRHSQRQGADMRLDGVVGHVIYECSDPELLAWLQAASVCHLGKATSFGFGRISCEVVTG